MELIIYVYIVNNEYVIACLRNQSSAIGTKNNFYQKGCAVFNFRRNNVSIFGAYENRNITILCFAK